MNFCFQDRENLYLIMDLYTGGDLRYHIGQQKRFKENETKFLIACVLLSLQFLHKNKIIHRDLKPENIVLDHNGYAYLTDLGIAQTIRTGNQSDTSGTPGYMAPEVMCRLDHGIAVDYFALGVIVYEFMLGKVFRFHLTKIKRPYTGKTRFEIRDSMFARQASIKQSEIPEGWPIEAADFANKLLLRKPSGRLGFNGSHEVMTHPWLNNFPFERLRKKELQSPFLATNIDDNYDYRNQIFDNQSSKEEMLKQNQLLLRRESVQGLCSDLKNIRFVLRVHLRKLVININ